jgi:nicotinamide mononucleotide transporter PnuC
MEWAWKYYGIDWIGTILAAVSIYFLSKKKKSGFIIGAISNLAWIVFGVLSESVGNIVACVIYITFNIYGWFQWSKKPRPVSETSPSPSERPV